MLDVITEVRKIDQEAINWRKRLHQIPEIGLNLPQTVRLITEELDKMGIEYHTLVNGNAVALHKFICLLTLSCSLKQV